MQFVTRVRKTVLTAHLAVSIGWAGALAGFLVLALVGLLSTDQSMVHAAYLSAELITLYAIVPLAFASLATGVALALGTPWGLLRHYWVLFKLVIALAATFMLVGKTGAISHLGGLAGEGALTAGVLAELRLSVAIHAVGGLAVLLWAATLGTFKPRAETGFRRRAA